MKLFGIVLMSALLACAMILPASGQDSEPSAMVTNYSIIPPVLDPGGLGMIAVVIDEIGAVTTTETIGEKGDEDSSDQSSSIQWVWSDTVDIDRVTLVGNGLTVISPAFDRIGAIGGTNNLYLTFLVRAPATSGIYYPEVRISTSGGSCRYPIPVNVNYPVGSRREPLIVLKSFVPGDAGPGDEVPVTCTVSNEGKTLAEGVTVKIENFSNTITPAMGEYYYVGGLNPGERKTLDLVLLTDRETEPGIVRIPVTMEYTLADGTGMRESGSIPLVLRGSADLEPGKVGTNPPNVGERQPFDLIVPVGNSGTAPARDVSVTIDLPVNGTRKVYVGTIGPGNETSVAFMMDGAQAGVYPFTTTLHYVDDTGSHSVDWPSSIRVTRTGLWWPRSWAFS